MLFMISAIALAAAVGGSPPQDDHRLDWWKEARFGLFIHWGLYAIPAGTWGNSTNHAEWILTTGQIPVNEYEKFQSRFNPTKFDADKLVKLAKDAGMKYITITTKHHDGFALYDSKVSDYDVMNTPFKRDIMKEMSDACAKAGIKMCWYHSIMDWHHPDYIPRRDWEKRSAEGADFDRYVKYLRAQVTELLTNYGPIGVMWFDGEWERTWNHEYGQELYDLCRRLQPSVIVNNRVDLGRGGMGGMSDAGYAGDFGTPEQEIPATGVPGVAWESCMTMNDHWGFNSHDHNYKSRRELIRMLVDIASKGGNFLLNIGPTAEGEFPPESVERLEQIGQWMKVNSSSIYSTYASPFKTLPWGRCTQKRIGGSSVLYLHVFDWPADGKLVLPGIGNDIGTAYLLASPRNRLKVDRMESDVVIDVGTKQPDPDCSVVAVQFPGRPVIYEAPKIVSGVDMLVKPIEVEITSGSDEIEVRYTLDGSAPTLASQLYKAPVHIDATTTLKARSFHHNKPVSAVAARTFTKVQPLSARSGGTVEGLSLTVYKGDWDKLPDFSTLTAGETKSVTAIAPSKEEFVGHRYKGFITVSEDDVYQFSLNADDGARLLIDGQVVIDNDGLHSATEKAGTIALAKGPHEIIVDWFNKTGGSELAVRWASSGGKLKPIEAAMLKH